MVQSCYNSSELGFLLADTRQVTAQRRPTPRTFPLPFFLSQVDRREGRGVRKGLGMKLPQKWSGQLYLPSGEAPRAQQRELHSGKSCWDRHRCRKYFFFFFFFNINKCTPGKSFSSLPPSLHANVKGCAKAFPIINHQESRKSAAETTKAALAAAAHRLQCPNKTTQKNLKMKDF